MNDQPQLFGTHISPDGQSKQDGPVLMALDLVLYVPKKARGGKYRALCHLWVTILGQSGPGIALKPAKGDLWHTYKPRWAKQRGRVIKLEELKFDTNNASMERTHTPVCFQVGLSS